MTQKGKINEVLVGIGLLLLGILAFIFLLSFSLLPPKKEFLLIHSSLLGTYKVHPLFNGPLFFFFLFWIMLPIIPLAAGEGALWRLKEALSFRTAELGFHPGTFWSRLASLIRVGDAVNGLLFISLFLLILGACIHELLLFPRTFSLSALVFLLSTGFFLVNRKRYLTLLRNLSNRLRKGMPTYTIGDKEVIITLSKGTRSRRLNYRPIHIGFHEIDELKRFSYVEAEAFLKYTIGPDLSLAKRRVQDFRRYLASEIPRPTVYDALSTQGETVFIKGKDIFYLITFDTDDVSDLLNTYTSLKEKKLVGQGQA